MIRSPLPSLAALLAAALLALSPPPLRAAEPALETEDQKTLYALGLALAGSLGPFGLTEAETALVAAGLVDGALNRDKKVDLQAYRPKIQELQRARLASAATKEKAAGQTFVAKAATEPGATKTASGLIITHTKPGTGVSPKATDTVKVHYHGTLMDGSVFDSSVQRGQPATFPLSGVIKCWTEGVQLMKVGGKSRLVCPSDIAYGDRGSLPRIRPGATLVFEVELLEIVEKK
jgi:FKBP-type peptidyl-prolyl cis-trans isomerase FkpA/FKBP-type peptidyl-prolyl cis-trans isomerase FklB